MRKKVTKLILVLIGVFLTINTGISTKAQKTYKVKVEKEIGFDNTYKIGYATPISLTIKNQGKNINGEVEVQVPSSPGKYMSYVRKLSLEKDGEKRVVINVPVSYYRGKYKIVITSEKNIVYESEIKFNYTNNNVTQFIGVLSDDYESLTYINKMPVASGMSTVTKIIKLTEENFPDDIFVLKAFNLLVINNFDTTKLSKNQYDVLKQWVADGGTLLIGTGANHKKTLGLFKDNFIEGDVGGSKIISTSLISEMATNGDSKTEVNIETLQVRIKGSIPVIQDKGEVLMQTIESGRGYIGIASFDFGQSPLAGWSNNTNFAEKLIITVNPNIIHMDNIDSMRQSNKGDDYYQLKSILNNFVEMATNNRPTFYLILFIYVLVVAPLNYFALKKLDKRGLMWATVPLISVLFSVFVYLSGFGSRLPTVTTNMLSIHNMDSQGKSTVSSYAAIFTPQKSKLRIETEDGDRIFPITDSYFFNDDSITKEDLEARIISDGNNGIEYVNSSILQPKILEIQSKESNIGKIDATINFKSGDLEGTIVNSTNLDLEECFLVTSSKYYDLGSMDKGASRNLEESKNYSHGGDMYQFVDMVYGYHYSQYSSHGSEREKLETIDKNHRNSIFHMVFNQWQIKPVENAIFIGITKNSSIKPLIVNGKTSRTNERNLLIMSIDLNFQEGDIIYYPKGFLPYSIWENRGLNYDGNIKALTGSGYTEIAYTVAENVIISDIEIEMSGHANGSTPVEFFIFNNSTNNYETISSLNISGEDVSKYCDIHNQIRLKVEMKDGYCEIPQLGVKGKVK
ncbi:MAG: hypothetical protein GX370_07830 [Clostridia bacterium]|jgi:hypothetical protein|nr:hypothetical protein [Clostridia bacterium]